MKFHARVESPGLSFNTRGTAVIPILVSSEAMRIEFGGHILSSRFVNTRRRWIVTKLTGNSYYLQG